MSFTGVASTLFASVGHVYFIDITGLRRATLDGQNEELLIGCGWDCTCLDLEVARATGLNYGTNACPTQSISLLGWDDLVGGVSGTIASVSDGGYFVGIALDESEEDVYWTLQDGPTNAIVQRANLDGSQLQTLVSDAGVKIGGVCIDANVGWVYWVAYDPLAGTGSVRRCDLNGQDHQELVPGLAQPMDIALDPNSSRLYWTDLVSGKIQSARSSDGGDVTDVLLGLINPLGIDLDILGGKVYWTEDLGVGNGKIRRADLDGANPEDVVLGLTSPIRLDVVAEVTSDAVGASRDVLSVDSPRLVNGVIRFAVEVPDARLVRAEVFSVRGERITVLFERNLSAGVHEFEWSGRDRVGSMVGSGVYLIRVSGQEEAVVRKFLFLK
jgi:hypothetical protein